MNIRILAASALALAILVPAANAASKHGARADIASKVDNEGGCAGGDRNIATDQCVPFGAKVVHARVVKHVAKPATAY